MKKVPSYPKITTKTNITVTQTQNININSPKAFALGFKNTKLFKLKPKQPKSKLKPISKSKHQLPPTRDNLHSHLKVDGKEEIRKLEDKLKSLQKKIDSLRQKKPELSSQRSKIQTTKDQSHSFVVSKSSVPKREVELKMLKKSHSDKVMHKPKIRKESKEEESEIIHKFVTQVSRNNALTPTSKREKTKSTLSQFYYIQSVLDSKSKPYLQPFKQHMQQSLQTMKYLQPIKAPAFSQLSKQILHLPPTDHTCTVVLDLDETLIHCNEFIHIPHDIAVKIKFPTGEKIDAGINIRPFARQLLRELASFCEVIVFTASHQCYANVVLDHLDPNREFISHRLFRNNCYQTEDGVFIKDLRVLQNRKLENVLLVDNAAYSYFFQMENGIPIVPFYDDKEDGELIQLLRYVQMLIKTRMANAERRLVDINNDYFQLPQYRFYTDVNTIAQKLYKPIVHKQF